MPRKISTLLNVSSENLDEIGVFDGFIDIDSRLHIDPSLLVICKIPEFENSYEDFQNYFKDILYLLVASKNDKDAMWREAYKRLQFGEIANTALGYSKDGTGGNAIGPKLAANIQRTVNEIIQAGINDPVIFELVGVLEEKIGADRISDMTISILIENFVRYTERVSIELGVETKKFKIKGKEFNLPFDSFSGKEILLLPKSLLNNLPIASCWSDIDIVCSYNNELRAKLNPIIGESWKSAMKIGKRHLKNLIFEHPDLLRELIQQYISKPRTSYDFVNDPLGELIWADLSEKAPREFPLNLNNFNPVTSENILEVVTKICTQYQTLIEDNGWFEYLYDNKQKLKPERAPQLLFYGIAEVYCQANNLDISRETNAGIGSLDFKVSKGFNAKVNVELKYSHNPNLLKGIEKQLPAYNKAEKADTSIYLIIQTKENRNSIDNVYKYIDQEKLKGLRVPEVFVIDGRRQVSASLRR